MRVKNPDDGREYELEIQYSQNDPHNPVQLEDTMGGRHVYGKGVTHAALRPITEEWDLAALVGEQPTGYLAWAVCSEHDKFEKVKGRTVAIRKLGNLLSKPFRTALWEEVRKSGMRLG